MQVLAVVSGVIAVAVIDDDLDRSWVHDVVDAVLSYVPTFAAVPFCHHIMLRGTPVLRDVG